MGLVLMNLLFVVREGACADAHAQAALQPLQMRVLKPSYHSKFDLKMVRMLFR